MRWVEKLIEAEEEEERGHDKETAAILTACVCAFFCSLFIVL